MNSGPAVVQVIQPVGRYAGVPALDVADLPPLDHAHGGPLWMQLAERFTTAIQRRRAELAGRMLPTELQSMEFFGVSRPTVRQAMAHLVAAGLVTRGRGRGSFVAPERLNHDVALAFEDEMRAARKTVRFQVLRHERIPGPPGVLAQLGQDADVMIDQVERLRFLDDKVFAHELRHFLVPVAQHVTATMLRDMAIISLLTAALGRPPGRIRNTVRCGTADRATARHFGLRTGAPLIQTEHVYFAASGEPLMHGIVRFRYDAVEFKLESEIRPGGTPLPSSSDPA